MQTLNQYKKSRDKKSVSVEVYSKSIYHTDIGDFIKQLQSIKKLNKHLPVLRVEVKNVYNYGDECAEFVITGKRLENKKEFDKRTEKEYEQYALREQEEKAQWKRLDKKFGK